MEIEEEDCKKEVHPIWNVDFKVITITAGFNDVRVLGSHWLERTGLTPCDCVRACALHQPSRTLQLQVSPSTISLIPFTLSPIYFTCIFCSHFYSILKQIHIKVVAAGTCCVVVDTELPGHHHHHHWSQDWAPTTTVSTCATTTTDTLPWWIFHWHIIIIFLHFMIMQDL